MGIALRRLANETRWTEIRDLNAEKYPYMVATDYYPVGTSIEIPMPDLSNLSDDGKKLIKSLEVPESDPEARAKHQAEMIAKRQEEIAESIAWWRKQEKIRVEGFGIVQTDPMYIKMNKRYQERKLEELLCVK